jgi:predicted nucleic-acid-binding protein
MAKKASIDTNALLRLLLDDVHEQYLATLKLMNMGYVFDVSDLVLAEALYVLDGPGYEFSRVEAVEAINKILFGDQFNCNTNMFSKALSLYVSKPALSLVDCCAAFYAELNDATPLYTFDKKLANQSNGLAKLIV